MAAIVPFGVLAYMGVKKLAKSIEQKLKAMKASQEKAKIQEKKEEKVENEENKEEKKKLEIAKKKKNPRKDLPETQDLGQNEEEKKVPDKNPEKNLKSCENPEKPLQIPLELPATISEITDFDSLLCPISQELLTDPVMTPYGHCYQRVHIESWLQRSETSPLSSQRLQKSDLIPCYAMKSLVNSMQKHSLITK